MGSHTIRTVYGFFLLVLYLRSVRLSILQHVKWTTVDKRNVIPDATVETLRVRIHVVAFYFIVHNFSHLEAGGVFAQNCSLCFK